MNQSLAAAALCVAILATMPAGAQTTHDEQLWLNLTISGRVSGRLLTMIDIQPRFGDGVSRLDTLIVRPAIGWQASPRVSVYAGYARVLSPVDGGRDRTEDRSFQQLFWTVKPGATEVLSRTRLEQRMASTGDRTGWRLRQMVRVETPLGRATPVKALGWAEGFVALNATDWGVRRGFDQLRTFAGVELPVEGRTTVELGYLNQAINDAGGRRRMRHAASLTLFVRL